MLSGFVEVHLKLQMIDDRRRSRWIREQGQTHEAEAESWSRLTHRSQSTRIVELHDYSDTLSVSGTTPASSIALEESH